MLHSKDISISITEPLSAKSVRALEKHQRIDSLSISKQKLITVAIAKGFATLQSVDNLYLWAAITRAAMRYIISIPNLEELDILEIRHPGKLENFSSASSLKIFRCNHCLSENDLLELSKLPNLQELSAQSSAITSKALNALLKMPNLTYLDLEGAEFNDEMAHAVSHSTKIERLDLGATKLTAKGLASICEMPQLRSLDIWAIDIIEHDLDLLSKLTKLEYLSIGGYDGQTKLTSKGIMPYLENIPSLCTLWLDGIVVTKKEEQYLKERYKLVRLTNI